MDYQTMMSSRPIVWGPSSQSQWLSRPLGYFESQMMLDFPLATPGPRRYTFNNLTNITLDPGAEDIKLDLWETAVQAIVYHQPNLRADVDLNQKPPVWIPASDFSKVFNFRDLRGTDSSQGGVSGVWSIVEYEVNKPWDYGSGKPLYRHSLMRVDDGYMVMNCFHHAVGDGITAMLVMKEILETYGMLLEGGENRLESLKPLDHVKLVEDVKDPGGVVDKMIKEKIDRVKHYKPILPLDRDETKANQQMELPTTKTLWREGSKASYTYIREKCRSEGVTVGALMLAASYIAKGVLYATLNPDWTNLTNLRVDVPVNLRKYLESDNNHAGMICSLVTVSADLKPDTSLWDLARQLGTQLKKVIGEKQHLMFFRVKEKFETDVKTASLLDNFEPEDAADILYSNVGPYPGPLVQSWGGTVRSVHLAGSSWTPGVCNYSIEIHSTDIFTYNLIHCNGMNNTETAGRYLDILVELLEGPSHRQRVTIQQLANKTRKSVSKLRPDVEGFTQNEGVKIHQLAREIS